jgi:hypothetical protein
MSCNAAHATLHLSRVCESLEKRRRPEPDIHLSAGSRNPQDQIERSNPGKAAMR